MVLHCIVYVLFYFKQFDACMQECVDELALFLSLCHCPLFDHIYVKFLLFCSKCMIKTGWWLGMSLLITRQAEQPYPAGFIDELLKKDEIRSRTAWSTYVVCREGWFRTTLRVVLQEADTPSTAGPPPSILEPARSIYTQTCIKDLGAHQ